MLRSDRDRIFCAGANIGMLGASSHQLKVNFCKFTNETRLAIEDACEHSGQRYLCAVRGTAAGGGYDSRSPVTASCLRTTERPPSPCPRCRCWASFRAPGD